MSKKDDKKNARKAAEKAARKAAKRAARQQSPMGKVDAFITRHAPSKADLRWYKFEIQLIAIAGGLVGLAHLGGLM